MLTEYLRLAMLRAHHDLLGDGEDLASTLKDWLLFRISLHLPLPLVKREEQERL